MGEIADMMINGYMCETCGVILDGEAKGIPRPCPACLSDQIMDEFDYEDDLSLSKAHMYLINYSESNGHCFPMAQCRRRVCEAFLKTKGITKYPKYPEQLVMIEKTFRQFKKFVQNHEDN